MSNSIEFNPWDLETKELDSGQEVVQIKPSIAFNETFIEDCKSKGVKPYVKREEPTDVD